MGESLMDSTLALALVGVATLAVVTWGIAVAVAVFAVPKILKELQEIKHYLAWFYAVEKGRRTERS